MITTVEKDEIEQVNGGNPAYIALLFVAMGGMYQVGKDIGYMLRDTNQCPIQ